MQTHKKYRLIQWIRRRNEQRKQHLLILATLLLMLAAVRMARGQEATLSPDQVMAVVKAYHPVARIAGNRVEQAKADITIARGGFDPQVYSANAQKTFDGTTYYNYNRPELSIPTWFGISVEAGLEYLSGSRTDPQETVGKTSYAGISIPLAKNLLMDKRRAALKTAQLMKESAAATRSAALNDLVKDALSAYWTWVMYYQEFRILDEVVRINETRFRLVLTGYQLGDRPAIDTLEALSQLQTFVVQREQALLDYRNAALELSVYLWNAEEKPVLLPADVVPAPAALQPATVTSPVPVLDSLLAVAREQHPELQLYQYKLKTLEVDRRLKFQELLPTINLQYNQLGKGYDLLKTSTGPLLENNFRYGLTIGMPLRLSAGRGAYRKARLKIQETGFEQVQKMRQIELKVSQYYNELLALQQQLSLQEAVTKQYYLLQRAEETRFSNGESSLFLVNSRETKYLEARRKLTALQAKLNKSFVSVRWASGQSW